MTQIIQSGYQQTDVGIIPEDWEVIKLNDCLELLTDFEANGGFADLANNVKTYDSENYAWYVRATDLENHSTLNDLRWVDEKSYKFLRKTSLYGGELLITKRGEIGKVYLFCSKTKFATLGPNLYLLKLNDKSCPKFLYYYFKYGYGNNLLKINNASTTLGALYKNDIKAIPIPYPDLKEQSFISKVLSDADVLIESLDNLIEKKKNIKQGAMQQLLTGKKRLSGFSEEWEAKRLGEIADVYNGGTPRTSIKEYWDGSIYWCIPTDITKTKGKYLLGTERKITEAGLENSSAKLLPIGSLLLCSRATIGELKISKIRVATNQGFKSLVCSKKVDSEFIYYKLLTIKNKLVEKAIGTTFLEISKKDTEDIVISIPPTKKEQTAIAQVLSDMDAEIEELEEKRDKYRHLKIGMMQQLLTGRIRLKWKN